MAVTRELQREVLQFGLSIWIANNLYRLLNWKKKKKLQEKIACVEQPDKRRLVSWESQRLAKQEVVSRNHSS